MSAPTAILGILIAVSMAPSIAADETSIGLAEAAEQGMFNVGTAMRSSLACPIRHGLRGLEADVHDPQGHDRGRLRQGVPPRTASGSHRPRASGGQGDPGAGPAGHGRDRDQGLGGPSADRPGAPARLASVRADHRLAGHRNGEGSRRPGQRHQRSRARHRHALDRCPVRAALSSPSAQHVIGGEIRRRYPGRPGPLVPGGIAPGASGRRSRRTRRRKLEDHGSRSPRAAVGRACSSRISSRASASC